MGCVPPGRRKGSRNGSRSSEIVLQSLGDHTRNTSGPTAFVDKELDEELDEHDLGKIQSFTRVGIIYPSIMNIYRTSSIEHL